MTEPEIILPDSDKAFFADHPDRNLRLRKPAGIADFSTEFGSLGPHQYQRRRIIVARLAPNLRRRYHRDFIEIPFLLAADETIEDRDDILAPILEEIMQNKAREYGMKRG